MRAILFGFIVIIMSDFSWAGLQYLVRTTTSQTAFETPPTTWNNPSDDDSINVSIGFNFPFKGNDYNHVYINTNGTLSFGSSSTAWNNTELNNNGASFEIYPYWDDMYPPGGGSIKYGTIGSGVNMHFVVSWKNLPHYSNYGNFSFQAILYQDGSIRFRYDPNSDADGSNKPYDNNNNGATIGVKEDDNHYDQYSYNATIDQTKDVLYSPVPPPTDNDYSEFRFDELEYTGASDEVRDSHWHQHGVGHSVPLVAGKICNAADFRSSSTQDYIKIGEGALDNATNFTISVWNKGPSGADSNALLSGANSSQDNEVLYWFTNNTKFNGHIKNHQKSINTQNINDGTWHHLVWRKKNKRTCFFFDGVKQGCKNYNSNYHLKIESIILGQDQDNVGGGFDSNQDWEGILDELLIFRKALTDNQIRNIYYNQNAGKNWDGSGPRVCPYPTVAKNSCIIDDPVNNTTHPKRIPGATIRYAIEVHNPNTSTIHNAETKDTINNHFDANTISHLKIGSGNCNCLNPGSTSNNGSNGGINGNEVRLDYGDVAGESTKCGYFEVKIK